MNKSDTPVFKFALRDDLVQDKRFLPTRANETDTGFDVRSAYVDDYGKPSDITLYPGDKVLIPLGFKAFCPEGYWFKLVPRSSTFGKKHLHCLYGTIDETYTGQLFFSAHYIPPTNKNNDPLVIKFGEAIGQVIPEKRLDILVEEISDAELVKLDVLRGSSRGSGGFGSTDKK